MPDRITTCHGTYHRMFGHWYALDGRGLHYSHHCLAKILGTTRKES